MNKFVMSLAKVGKVLCRLFIRVKVFGDKNVPNKRSVIVGNHISGWDPIAYTVATKNFISFVYKAEFQKNAFLRWALGGLDCIPVHRGEADINATKCILRLLRNDKAVCLFPEGTRNPEVDCLQPFHTGAALFALKTHAPLRAFYIWDKTKAFRKNYMIIGEEFTLEEFYGLPLDHGTLESATEVIRGKMDALRVELNQLLQARGVKRRPRTQKEKDKIRRYNEKQRALAKQAAEQSGAQSQDNADGAAVGAPLQKDGGNNE